MASKNLNTLPSIQNNISFQVCPMIRFIGIAVSILILWNGVGDFIYAYSPNLGGLNYLSPDVWNVIATANNRPHWMIMMAQTAGWFYPIYALTYFNWWVGMQRAGIWLSLIPNLLLAYAVLMIGGIQHAGFAFLSVLSQAKEVVGSSDPNFYSLANRYIVEHFIIGDLTAALALYIGTIWHGIAIISGRTSFPKWFIFFSPLGTLIITMILGIVFPAPISGIFMALFGTWFVLVPNIAGTIWVWKRACATPEKI